MSKINHYNLFGELKNERIKSILSNRVSENLNDFNFNNFLRINCKNVKFDKKFWPKIL